MSDDLRSEYDTRYRGGYRGHLEGYEVARWEALRHFFKAGPGREEGRVSKVLDYGAGSGLFAPLWENLFPNAEISFCDISSVARDRFLEAHRSATYRVIEDGQAPFDDNTYDLVISIEVMEHVEKLLPYLCDVFRVLKPNGTFVWTTPCANLLSIEQIYAFLTSQRERSATGELRWKWEDVSHLRRMKSRDTARALMAVGFGCPVFRYRAHLFSFWATRGLKQLSEKRKERLMTLDYRWFRHLPNGASMIGKAIKPNVAGERGTFFRGEK